MHTKRVSVVEVVEVIIAVVSVVMTKQQTKQLILTSV